MSESRDYIKRLEALNGRPLENQPKSGPDKDEIRRIVKKRVDQNKPQTAEPVVRKRDVPVSTAPVRKWGPSCSLPSGPPVSLEEALKGVEVCHDAGGKAYVITKPISLADELRERSADLCCEFSGALSCCKTGIFRKLKRIYSDDRLCPEDLIFVDLETTGLGNTPLFLIGTMVWEGDGLVVRQYLARDYSEEPAVTRLFIDDLAKRKLLVTFNGKSFDMPYVRTRAVANGVRYTYEPPHLDLLHESRRAWRSMLPNCKLQTLERHICGRTREGDIAGCDIPDAYHNFVRTSNAVQMVEIIRHNLLDLATMADLMVRFP